MEILHSPPFVINEFIEAFLLPLMAVAMFVGLRADSKKLPHTGGKKRAECKTRKGKGNPCAAVLCQEWQCSPLDGLPSAAASEDQEGYKDDFCPAFHSHCHNHGGDFTSAEKLTVSSGWARTKQALLMYHCVFPGV